MRDNRLRIAVQRSSWDVMHHRLVTPEFTSWLERACPGTRVTAVSDEEILRRCLDWFDALFFPGSVGSAMAVEKYGSSYRAIVRDFVRRGGCFIGVCGGCYVAVQDFQLRPVARTALSGALRKPGPLKGTMEDISGFDRQIGRKTGRAVTGRMASAMMRGKLKTFDLIDATATAPRFFGNPEFIRDEWSRLVTDGRLLKVRLRITGNTNPLTRGHEGELLSSAYSGGAILDSPGYAVVPLATYEPCDAVPEAAGKVAAAFARFGDGLVVVSGPDYYLPFEAEPGVTVRDGMQPSVPWLTERILSGHVECRKLPRASA